MVQTDAYNNNSGFLYSAHVCHAWHSWRSRLLTLALAWLPYGALAFQGINSCQVLIYITWVECGKCRSMSCRRTSVPWRDSNCWPCEWQSGDVTYPLDHNTSTYRPCFLVFYWLHVSARHNGANGCLSQGCTFLGIHVLKHLSCTVNPALGTTCLQRPPVYKDHIFVSLETCTKENLSTKTTFCVFLGRSLKTGFTVFEYI